MSDIKDCLTVFEVNKEIYELNKNIYDLNRKIYETNKNIYDTNKDIYNVNNGISEKLDYFQKKPPLDGEIITFNYACFEQ